MYAAMIPKTSESKTVPNENIKVLPIILTIELLKSKLENPKYSVSINEFHDLSTGKNQASAKNNKGANSKNKTKNKFDVM